MNPDTAAALAELHRHDLITRAARERRAAASPRPRHLPPRGLLPRYRLSWSRTTLSSRAGQRGHAWVIVISATRGLRTRCTRTKAGVTVLIAGRERGA